MMEVSLFLMKNKLNMGNVLNFLLHLSSFMERNQRMQHLNNRLSLQAVSNCSYITYLLIVVRALLIRFG